MRQQLVRGQIARLAPVEDGLGGPPLFQNYGWKSRGRVAGPAGRARSVITNEIMMVTAMLR